MTLPSKVLSLIQRSGTTLSAADRELKNALKQYTTRVNQAMSSNPHDLGNDALIEEWKLVARLAKTLESIEADVKNAYHLAASIITEEKHGSQPALTMSPRPSVEPEAVVTDVIAKRPGKTAKVKAVKKGNKKVLVKKSTNDNAEIKGNAAILLKYLESVLNPNDAVALGQTAIANGSGLPLGSVTASLKRLVELERIEIPSPGNYKLVEPAPAA